MYQKILVPVDGSPTSNRAVQEAVKLAQLLGSQLELVHVYEDIVYLISKDYISYEELQRTVRSCGEKILTEAEMLVKEVGLEAETRIIQASKERVAQLLVAEAERWQADLIVIGTHGHTGFSRLLLGSVAEGLVRIAPIPVLLIRGQEH
ncbi:universal stress protein [Nitrosomonas halophila]|jgi:nucleotide-binding universal stress UspA family protein|uniref:Universal stress protein n=1 Tax=Nitrosomonas halophila TaxID=44576 RepID=A0A1H3HVI2_9PROT|nr:universal stress protein [Nitrosomonas halophila]SDY19493.1 Nucleotide-binding universal stress protein, UspA family [Nitrosomonas halophila]